MRPSPHSARVITAVVTLFTLCSVPWLTEAPLGAAHHTTRYAALAVRDDVSDFEELGTALFTRPALERSYHEVRYITLGPARASWDDVYDALDQLASGHERVDVFLLTHGNAVSQGFAATEAARRGAIGLVYHTGCGNALEGERWIALGAQTFISHVGLSQSPVYYVSFLRRWLRGGAVQEAHQEANRLLDARMRPLDPASADGSAAMLFGDRELSLEGSP